MENTSAPAATEPTAEQIIASKDAEIERQRLLLVANQAIIDGSGAEIARLKTQIEEIGDAATWLICDPATRLSDSGIKFLATIRNDGSNAYNDLRAEIARLKAELDWQNRTNQRGTVRGAYEFYINEEWMGVARANLDTDTGFHATLRKKRIDPDDERVRVRRVIDDDILIAENATLRAELDAAKADSAMLDEIQRRRLTVTWNPRHDGFIIQEQEQVCGNIAHNSNLRAAIADAMKGEK